MLANYERDYVPFTMFGGDYVNDLIDLGRAARRKKKHDNYTAFLNALSAMADFENEESEPKEADESLFTPHSFDMEDLTYDEDHLKEHEEPSMNLFDFLTTLAKATKGKEDEEKEENEDNEKHGVHSNIFVPSHSFCDSGDDDHCDCDCSKDKESDCGFDEKTPVTNKMELPIFCTFDPEEKTTTAYWKDGKTVVTAEPEDEFDPFLGVMYCCMEHATGGKEYLNSIRRLIKKAKAINDLCEDVEKAHKERKEIEERKKAKRIATKARRKKKHEVEVMKEALLQLKEEGLL